MVRHTPDSIKNKGLKIHLEENNIDYNEFIRLDDMKLNNTVIGKMLGVGRHTIKHWRQVRDTENK